jgi:hypothetical protein
VLFFEPLGQYIPGEGERRYSWLNRDASLSPSLGISGKERRRKSFLITIGTLLLLC